MECSQCPLTLPCYAGRLYEGRTQGMLCPLCNRFTVVHFQVYNAQVRMSGVLPPITFEISAADMGVSLSARDNLKSCHTVLHCPERKLAETQIAFWQCHQQDIIDRTVKGDQVFGSIPYSMFDPHPGYNANSDVRLNVVPCAVCEPNRYGKAVMVEKLE